jgi:hypothetical protein
MPSSRPSVFISYRREGGAAEARMLQTFLESIKWRVFLDVDNMEPGHFDEQILTHIEKHDAFILVCSPGCLDACSDEADWVRREIVHAIKFRRRIVPFLLPAFKWPSSQSLPEDLHGLPKHHGFHYSHTHWRATRADLLRMLEAASSDPHASSREQKAAERTGRGRFRFADPPAHLRSQFVNEAERLSALARRHAIQKTLRAFEADRECIEVTSGQLREDAGVALIELEEVSEKHLRLARQLIEGAALGERTVRELGDLAVRMTACTQAFNHSIEKLDAVRQQLEAIELSIATVKREYREVDP